MSIKSLYRLKGYIAQKLLIFPVKSWNERKYSEAAKKTQDTGSVDTESRPGTGRGRPWTVLTVDNVGGLAGDLMFIQDCALQTRQSVCEFFQEYRNLSVISWSHIFRATHFGC